ncbi:hypothetical protein HHL11_12215 [Ramlibacter sp. G-1-2-2]|uniref:Uncharacterized protein n=1 Tax=Ramlibacter agri TaxID=2728837 RepID=A0A848H4R3_9BURK|nr:hypothetical protein [Ramlibacter agri]NML44521.1 hypothetical protein [Ramlibacter agri]
MDFFNSLTLDLKMLVVAIAGCVLLALFSGNRRSETRYMVVLALLAAVGVYRFMHSPHAVDPGEAAAANFPETKVVKAQPKHTPLVSTSAK